MRWRVGGRHVGVSGRVPTQTGMAEGLAALITLPVQALVAVVLVLTAVLWLLKWTLKISAYLVIGITAPIWLPLRGLHRRHERKANAKAVARVRRLNAIKLAQPPTGNAVG